MIGLFVLFHCAWRFSKRRQRCRGHNCDGGEWRHWHAKITTWQRGVVALHLDAAENGHEREVHVLRRVTRKRVGGGVNIGVEASIDAGRKFVVEIGDAMAALT